MAHFFKGNTEGTRIFAVVEKGAEFGFGGTGQDLAHNVAEDVDGSIGLERTGGRGRLAGGEKISGGARSSFCIREIRRVALDGEEHVAGGETDGGNEVRGAIIQKLD